MAVNSLQKIRITTYPQLIVQQTWPCKEPGGMVTVDIATLMVSIETERTMELLRGVKFAPLRELK